MKIKTILKTAAIAVVALLSVIRAPGLSAQISFTPSSLTWSAEDRSPKTVTVHSSGWWDTDSTNFDSHFMFSRYNGSYGCEIDITPVSANSGSVSIVESIAFWGSGGTSYLQLTHSAVAGTLSVSPSSLSWGYSSTASMTVSVSCSGSWTAGTDAEWIGLSGSSGTGNGSLTVRPLTANPSGAGRSGTLYVWSGSSLMRSVSLSQGGAPSAPPVAVSPSTLTWEAGDTSPQTVAIASSGRWYTDSTGTHMPEHFILGQMNGSGDALVQVHPVSSNPWYNDTVEDLQIWDDDGHTATLHLRHRRRFTEDPADTTNTNWTAVTAASRDTKGSCDALASYIEDRENPTGGNAYDAGRIPLEEGTTPTGGRTYLVRIPAAAGIRFVPEVALAYNSQGGNGVAGFGWSLSGLSSVSIIPKTRYWHGTQAAARVDDAEAAGALDGVPFVANEGPDYAAAYPLVTARGRIFAKAHRNGAGVITHFTAIFPDGTRATFGWSDGTVARAVYPVTEKTDRYGHRITYEYSHAEDGGSDCRITSIRYGYDAGGIPAASVTFTYAERSDRTTTYFAGTTLTNGYILKGISSLNGVEVLAQYGLTHELSEEVNLLKGISCSDGAGHSLPPLNFTYVRRREVLGRGCELAGEGKV